MPKPTTRRAYSVAETAEITGIPESTLYRWAREGKADHLGCVRAGSKTIFSRAVIDKKFPPSEVAS